MSVNNEQTIQTQIISSLDQQFYKLQKHLQTTLASIRAGRISPSIIENVPVECYGTKNSLCTLATFSIQNGRTIIINPWNKSLLKDIERALQENNYNPQNNGHIISLNFPSMTEEHRNDMIKFIKNYGEDSRVSIRKLRHTSFYNLKAFNLSQDTNIRIQNSIETKIDLFVNQIDKTIETKIKEMET